MSTPTKSLDRLLAHAERTIAMTERCRPLNAVAEQRRVLAAWGGGVQIAPQWRYAPRARLDELLGALEAVATHGQSSGEWGRLYAERADELLLEGRIADALGTPEFSRLAAQRYPADVDGAEQAARWALRWCADWPGPVEQRPHLSDDQADPGSLYAVMCRAVGELRLPFRVKLSADLPSAAACGDGILVVKTGIAHRALDVARIVAHEIEGHALPRFHARAERIGLLRVGTRSSADDEEGRALLIEKRHGCLDAQRRAELAWRHLAASCVRQGADWVETTRRLLDAGVPLGEAVHVSSRVHRGGGLARELAYLPALARVQRALDTNPELEAWMRRGRVGIEAARVLDGLGDPPESIKVRHAA